MAGFVPWLIALLFCAACSSAPPTRVVEILDPLTSVTITTTSTPVVFFRDVPSRAAYARDYLQVAPIEVNRTGTYRYYIWLGVWSTMGTIDPVKQRDGLESIVVFADGEPLNFEVAGWTPETIGASEPVNLRPVADAIDAYYAITADQIRLLANASDVRVHTLGPSFNDFELWENQKAAFYGLQEFLGRVAY